MLRQVREIIALQVESGETEEGRKHWGWEVGNITRDQPQFLQLTEAQETSVLQVDSSVGGEVEDLDVWSQVEEVPLHPLKSVVGQAEVVELVKSGQILSGYLSVFGLGTADHQGPHTGQADPQPPPPGWRNSPRVLEQSSPWSSPEESHPAPSHWNIPAGLGSVQTWSRGGKLLRWRRSLCKNINKDTSQYTTKIFLSWEWRWLLSRQGPDSKCWNCSQFYFSNRNIPRAWSLGKGWPRQPLGPVWLWELVRSSWWQPQLSTQINILALSNSSVCVLAPTNNERWLRLENYGTETKIWNLERNFIWPISLVMPSLSLVWAWS